jgi:hypothetical protein
VENKKVKDIFQWSSCSELKKENTNNKYIQWLVILIQTFALYDKPQLYTSRVKFHHFKAQMKFIQLC